MNLNTALTLLVTVCLALIGYVYALYLARRKDRLKRINRQLSDLYGPLFALSITGAHVWSKFRKQHRPEKGSFWKSGSPIDDKDADAFRLWIRSVFMPLNRQMMTLVVNRADLLEGTEIPDCLLELCAHISSYEALLVQWEQGDHSVNEPIVNFPRHGLQTFAQNEFERLKQEQDVLLSSGWHHMFRRRDNSAPVIKAAGGVVYYQDESGERTYAVIHKRRYQEWCLPKGKLQPNESWKKAATREVKEETGSNPRVLELTALSAYLVKGTPKIVVFFAMEASARPDFVPSQEIDRVQWLNEEEVRRRLSHEGEREAFDEIIRALGAQGKRQKPTMGLGDNVPNRAALVRQDEAGAGRPIDSEPIK